VEAALAGMTLVLDACDDDCNRRVAQPLDMVARLVVDSPHRIPQAMAHARLRYVLARVDGERPRLATTGEQAVAYDGRRAVVTVCGDCGEATQETPATLAPFLAPNAWVRSDDPSIRRVALLAGRNDAPLASRMRRLALQVRRRMRNGVDVLGYADAVQALRTGRGDCTEYAVLFAALARARGIPTRVAVGMVYASRFTGRKFAFGPHAWVQAWDGTRWVSFDAAYDGFDSTHVALATGTGEPGPMLDAFVQLRQLRIERLGAVAP
jgi:transglutaminase-like putative cysteine protease